MTTPPPTPGNGDDDEKVEPVRYTLVVEGFEEIGLEDRFRELSALEDADGQSRSLDCACRDAVEKGHEHSSFVADPRPPCPAIPTIDRVPESSEAPRRPGWTRP